MNKTVFIIAGEASGDNLGAGLMQSLKAQNPELSINGIGGEGMIKQGLKSYCDMDQLCVMGITEVAKQYPRLRKLGYEIIEHIERTQPDILITIDLPDFNFAIAKRLKKRGVFNGKIIHYVAPTVWAWRAGRAKKIAKFLDGILCLFPFEPPYFEEHGLKAKYIGHPIIQTDTENRDPESFKKHHDIDKSAKTLGVFFGSRKNEIEILAPIFLETCKNLQRDYPNLHLIIPTLKKREEQIQTYLQDIEIPYTIITNPAQKWNAFAACDAALAVSGTIGLELAYAKVPHVIAYKASRITAAIIKRMVKTPYAHLANILLDKMAVPEFIQEKATGENLTAAIKVIMESPEKQEKDFGRLHEILGEGNPSDKATKFITKYLG